MPSIPINGFTSFEVAPTDTTDFVMVKFGVHLYPNGLKHFADWAAAVDSGAKFRLVWVWGED